MKMWPKLLDLSQEESKRVLRRLELEAYSSIISAFRAHGDLTKEKKKLLSDLQHVLSISTERHRAEVRRAVNDEKLTTIADCVSGPNISSEWLIEGRRLIPLMPRLVPQTAFTSLANTTANVQAEKNASMVPPYATASKEITTLGPVSTGASTPTGVTPALVGQQGHVIRAHPHRPTSPNSNIVVLPSGMSIRIEGGLNTDEDEDVRTSGGKRRRRSSSATSHVEHVPITLTPPASRHTIMPTFNQQHPTTQPMKITFAKSPQKTVSAVSPATSQKVILVSSAASTTTLPTVVQRLSTTLAGSASTTTTSAADTPKSSVIPPTSHPHSMALTSTTPTAVEGSSQHQQIPTFVAQNVMGKVRPRMVHRGRPAMHTSTRPGMVVPVSPQTQTPGHVQVRAGKPTIQVKHEGGMKIITHAVGGKAGTKSSPVMTRPASGGAQMVVVSNASSIAMVTKSVTAPTGSAGIARKVVNVSAQGAKMISTARGAGTPNVVTVNPKTLQITAVKSSTGTKPNVIVVQKAQPKHGQRITTTATTLDKVPDLVSFLQKQEGGKGERLQLATTPSTSGLPSVVRVEKKGVNKPQLVDLGGKKFQIRTTDGDLSKSSVLAEIIQQASLASEAATAAANVQQQQSEQQQQQQHQQQQQQQQQQPAQQGVQGLNEWVDYDVVADSESTSTQSLTAPTPTRTQDEDEDDEKEDASVQAIKSLLKLQQGPQSVQQVQAQPVQVQTAQPQSTRVNVKRLPPHLGDGQYINIDESSGVPSGRVRQARLVAPSGSTVQLVQTPGGHTRALGAAVGQAGGQEVLGELDPQTGLFYPAQGKKDIGPIISLVDKTGKGAPIDIFSSALAEAQIDLEPYQFMEEPEADVPAADVEQASKALAEATATGPGPQFAVLPQSGHQGSQEPEPEPAVTPAQLATMSVEPERSDTDSASTSAYVTMDTASTSAYVTMEQIQQIATSGASEVVAIVTEPSETEGGSSVTTTAPPNVSVAVEPTGLDPSLMNLEDFTSQRLDDPGSSSADDSGGSLGKRKRRPPAALDESPPHAVSVGSWIRGAMNLIQRVSRYRGANREKGQINAAAWFLRPVNPTDAPDYYKVINTPMDFGTIRRKLETGLYSNLDEFHQDMCLIRQNCHQYNPPNHQVRRDCDEVFHYYIAEYERLVDRLKTGGMTSPPVKKPKVQSP